MKRIRDAWTFRNEECHWGFASVPLTPFHLNVGQVQTFEKPRLFSTLTAARDRLAVAYLADSAQLMEGACTCEFRGYKRVHVTVPAANAPTASEAIYNLFAWAYENSSSDKLGLTRQVVSLQLSEDAEGNYALLSKKAHEILSIARSNFRLFLQRNVELYFDKRLKVSEFLQKFSQDVGSSISAMSSELLDNLYKTIGVILGAVVASILGPDKARSIIWLAALLYFLYIVFVLVYISLSSYLRFCNKVAEYEHSVAQLKDVLSSEEIINLQGTSYSRAKWSFFGSFALTVAIYGSLGATAFLIMRSV